MLKSQAAVSPQVHVAFSGGGWRAHTGHAGWTIALLGNGSRTLSEAFANVGTISSNSGGSWFSTMLMYSDVFDQHIQATNAIDSWNATGWLGQQHALFAKVPACSVDPYLLCVLDYYTNDNPGYWDTIVKNLVFHDYPLGTLPLSGTRQPWAAGKPLLLAATMLTNEVVLNSNYIGDKRYYQACLTPAQPVLNGNSGSSCNSGPTPDVTPVTFSSIPAGLNLTALPFLREAAGTGSRFNMGYTENAWIEPGTAQAIVQNPLSTGQVPVIIAAAASSAAGGFVACGTVSNDWEASYEGEDEALSFQLTNASVQAVNANGMSVQTLAAQKVVRIADGGVVDNSGVAQLVSFLQLNSQADNFNIVAFDNVQAIYTPPGGKGAQVGIDFANLFGLGTPANNKLCYTEDGLTFCVSLPDLQIFDSTALVSTPVTWKNVTGPSQNPQGVIYTQYKVTTVNNNALGVAKGTTGTLHAYTCIWPTANTAPTGDGDFNTYNAMLRFIYNSMQVNNGEGRKHLEAALKLQK